MRDLFSCRPSSSPLEDFLKGCALPSVRDLKFELQETIGKIGFSTNAILLLIHWYRN